MADDTLRVAFLVGKADANTRQVIRRICELRGVEVAAVLMDTAPASASQRWRNLKRNIRREGLSYPFYRAITALRDKLEQWADRVIPDREVERLLSAAFPGSDLNGLAQTYGFAIVEAGNLNGEIAMEALRRAAPDVGIVLGTRILKRSLFSIPRRGCINLHKGKVPEYRGMPPGFWELYDGRESAGVTVHFVDDGLDTGDVLGEVEVPIHPKETPESLKTKLDQQGTELTVSVVEAIRQGVEQRRKQPAGSHKTRTRPTRVQQNELERRLPHWRRLGDLRQAVKNAVWLGLYYGGVYSLVRWMRRNRSRGAILLYHRVNDISVDVLTASTRRFAEHLVTLRHYYRIASTEELVGCVASRSRVEPTSVAVHFDDCYLDVRQYAAPLLTAAGIPATAFVSSGFVDTDRVFSHDEAKYPQRFENLTTKDLLDLPGYGVTVAAHTVNHADLGKVSLEQASVEVIESGRQLEEMTGRPVLLFSFPFGKLSNIREEVREMVKGSGYQALFSAGGGFIGPKTSLFDIPRFGVSSDHSPLALMMELEGLSLAHLSYVVRAFRNRSR
jgi:peptidoglycan/xylan/chitin deacetylase (PgdA/CDA1 family)